MRLLDANVFIEAKNRYYGFDLVPAFWTWLEDQAESGEIGSTDMIYDELKDGGDDLAAWVKDRRELTSTSHRVRTPSPLPSDGSAPGFNPRTTSRTSSLTSWTAPTPSS